MLVKNLYTAIYFSGILFEMENQKVKYIQLLDIFMAKLSMKVGSFIVSPEQLNCVLKYCFDNKVNNINVYTDLPSKVESEYAYIDKKINELDLNYMPKLTLWTKPDDNLSAFLKQSRYVMIVYRPLLNKKFMNQFNDVILHAKSKECCLFMLLDQPIVGSFRLSLNEIPKVYFR